MAVEAKLVLRAVTRMSGRHHLDESWASIIRKDPCSFCGRPRAGTVDHIVPKARGGPKGHAPNNSTAACPQCNTDRGTVSVLAFLAFHAGFSVELPASSRKRRKRRQQIRRRPAGSVRRDILRLEEALRIIRRRRDAK